jgi:hypothetical protein
LDLAPCAFGDTVEREGTDAGAVEPDNGEVVGGEHAADLVVAPFEEPDGGGAGAGEGEGGWAAGFGFAVEEERARGAKALADGSTPVQLGSQRPGDLAYYPGHVMVVCGQAGAGGHSPVIGASGGTRTTLGQDPNARIKTFTSGAYRKDFVTYMRLK